MVTNIKGGQYRAKIKYAVAEPAPILFRDDMELTRVGVIDKDGTKYFQFKGAENVYVRADLVMSPTEYAKFYKEE